MQFSARDRLVIVHIELILDDAIKDTIYVFSESQQIYVSNKFVAVQDLLYS
jgi:hypothetical protein